MKKKKVKSIFISDVHLGSKFCMSKELHSFLKKYECENLYLVGDFIDGWKLKKNFYWNDEYSYIIRKILSMLKHNTKIFYISGNHDEFLRNFLPQDFGNIIIRDEIVHTTVDGKKVLVIHGDIFDHLTKHMTWAYHLGDKGYSLLLYLNKLFNYIRRSLGLQYWSFSKMAKRNFKEAVNYINNFEYLVAKYAVQNECDFILCGHVHTPVDKQIKIDGKEIRYLNCGDFVESCTAIIEDLDGKFKLLDLSHK